MRYILVLVAALQLSGCDSLRSLLDPGNTDLPRTLELHAGQTAWLPAQGIFITFEKVTQDSRCPDGAVCVWEGDGAARVSIFQRNLSATACTLHTTLMPKSIDIGGLSIALKKLRPLPVLGRQIEPAEYVVQLDVTDVGSTR